MDSAELNEIKGTQSGQFVSLIIFLGKFDGTSIKGLRGGEGVRVRKNLIPQPAP
jgi:hypothetical protein